MHEMQRDLLDLATRRNLADMSLREIGKEATGEEQYPQLVAYHLEQLIQAGLLRRDRAKKEIIRVTPGRSTGDLLRIPIVGQASCGPATVFADECVSGYLHVSKRLLSGVSGRPFAVRAVGDSMNRARALRGGPIEDGDYVVVDSGRKIPHDGKYYLSIIDDVANIKKVTVDKSHDQIILESESSGQYPPIFVHKQDQPSYFIAGEAVSVLKAPRKKS